MIIDGLDLGVTVTGVEKSEALLGQRVEALVSAAGYELQTASRFVIRQDDGSEVTVWTEPACAYHPKDVPAVIVCNPKLTDHERLLGLVHELMHACLHPPGRDDYDHVAYLREEPCAHEAARIICSEYEIMDYRDVWLALGVEAERFDCQNDGLKEVMVERVGAALEASMVRPSWAEPITDIGT